MVGAEPGTVNYLRVNDVIGLDARYMDGPYDFKGRHRRERAPGLLGRVSRTPSTTSNTSLSLVNPDDP